MSRIGLIGTGHIGGPIARFLAAKGHEILVTERSSKVSSRLVKENGVKIGSPQAVLDGSEIVFLCLRPQAADAILRPLEFRPDHQIVSVMAGVSQDRLARVCHPARDFTQFVPLGFLEKGGFPTAAFGNPRMLAALFEPENPVIALKDEGELNAHMAACSSVPGILDLLATVSGWLAEQTGNGEKAEFYTSQLLAGFLATMDKTGEGQLAAARDELATEGTYSLNMTTILRNKGAHDALREALTENKTRMDT